MPARARIASPCSVDGRVHVRIVDCVLCGYRGRAERLATAIQDHLGLAAKLEHGRLSQFDVFVDDELIASRVGGILNHLTWGGFPDEATVVEKLAHLTALPVL